MFVTLHREHFTRHGLDAISISSRPQFPQRTWWSVETKTTRSWREDVGAPYADAGAVWWVSSAIERP